MKKTIAAILPLLLACALLAGCGTAAPPDIASDVTQLTQAAPAQNSQELDQQTTAAAAGITLEQAKAIALKDAGVNAADALFTKTRRDYDDGAPEYEIDFNAGGWEYDYSIHAETGAIRKSERERIPGAGPTQSQMTTPPVSSGASSSAGVTLEKAKEIALKHAGVAAKDAVFTKARQDYDDGVLEYEIDFVANNCEYDYSIHAGTGRILEHGMEYITKPGQSQTGSPHSAATDISLEKAKEIAVKHAGLTIGQVRFTDAELDHEDGIAVYEIEFKCDGWEYEYVIHAGTGAVLKWDKDD